ncbi:hypothetical protein Tco_1148665, partial [Tanacetum coccineum]
SGVGLVLKSPSRHDFTYALKFEFDVSNNESEYEDSNNESEYEALLAGLCIAKNISQMNSSIHELPTSGLTGEGRLYSKGRINEVILGEGESDPSILQLFLYNSNPLRNKGAH